MYGTPEALVIVGDLEVAPESVRVSSDRHAPIARAEVSLDRDFEGQVSIGQDLVVCMGYRGQGLMRMFRGRVREVSPGRVVSLVAQDRMRDLADVRIRQAFRNVTIQEVITWCFERAGVNSYTLSPAFLPRRHHFIVADETGLDVLRRAAETWSVPWDYYADADGTVWVMPWEESPRAQADPVVDLEYGDNLLSLEPRLAGTGTAEMLLTPVIQHSHRVVIRDDRLWHAEVLARVERVEHRLDEQGGRTRIEWTLLRT